MLLSGLPTNAAADSTPAGLLTPETAVPPLTPTGLHLTIPERAALRIGELTESGASVRPTRLQAGGTLPDVDANGRIAYLVLDPRLEDAGQVWVASFTSFPSSEVELDPRALESSVQFAPAPDALLVAREALPVATPSPTPGISATPSPTLGPVPSPPATLPGPGGIWLLNLLSGTNRQLSADGWLPSWRP